MPTLLLALFLAQTVVPTKVVDPTLPSQAVTTSKLGLRRTLDVNPPPYALTAFGEARVAQPYTLLDLVNKYGIDPIELDTQVSGGGAVTAVRAQSAITLTVTAASGDAARLRTNTYYRYQAGRGQRFTQTVYLTANAGASANQAVRWGYFDANDGLFWQRTGGALFFCQRSSTSGSPVDSCQAVTLPAGADLTKGSIYEVAFQWLGVGTVRAWWNGTEVLVRDNANTLAAPYMRTADLPLSWEVVNAAAAQAATLTVICANVTSQGGSDAPEYGFAAARMAFKTGIGATDVPIIAIRLASTYNTVDNRMVVIPHVVRAANESGRSEARVYLNPTTLTGPSWVAVGAPSGVEYDISATAFTGGTLVATCAMPVTAAACVIDMSHYWSVNARKLRRSAFAGTSDVLLVVGHNEAGATSSIKANIEWTEIR